MASDRIKIFVTGGTFDKEYNEITAELYFNQTHVADMLKLGRCHLEVDIETLFMIDSLQMTDAHRQLLLDRCAHDPPPGLSSPTAPTPWRRPPPSSAAALPPRPSF